VSFSSVVILIFLAFSSGGSSRCECVTFPTTEADRLASVRRELQQADAVFVGTIADLVDTGNSVGRRVNVNHVWKGTPDKEAVLAIMLRGSGNSCWYSPQSGQHLIFAQRDSSGWMTAYSCGSTGPIGDRAEVSRFLKDLCQNTELCGKKEPQIRTDKLPSMACSRQRRANPGAAAADAWRWADRNRGGKYGTSV
jgi:hypothetical protein